MVTDNNIIRAKDPSNLFNIATSNGNNDTVRFEEADEIN